MTFPDRTGQVWEGMLDVRLIVSPPVVYGSHAYHQAVILSVSEHNDVYHPGQFRELGEAIDCPLEAIEALWRLL